MRRVTLFSLLLSLAAWLPSTHAQPSAPAGFDGSRDDDLLSFVTMPNTRAIKFNVTQHHPDRISPGYWFVAPYWYFEADPPDGKFMPCQVGPHIYDGDGTLVWAGSCLHHNRNVFDFKPVNRWPDQRTRLSFILQRRYVDDGTPSSKGAAYILNDRYEVEAEVPVTNDLERFDLHEFNVLAGGQTALAVSLRVRDMPLTDLGRPEETSRVASGGVVEIDLAAGRTGQVLFDWDSREHIPLHESDHVLPSSPAEGGGGLDYIHVNAADKSPDGDYLMSARYTSTLYLISGRDGRILWRLGGKYSDFAMDFTFSKQHNARFVSVNATHTVLSFLNNASDDFTNQEPTSAALVVLLDTVHRTATLLRRFPRPDGGLSRMRGNFQLLDEAGQGFVGWSEQGYHSEHAPDGTVVMEARFASPRFNSYRSYKFPFRGDPPQPPALVARAFDRRDDESTVSTTVFHVSWNGATEVAHWRFYARAHPAAAPVLLGNVTKRDFESRFAARGVLDWVSAEAVDRAGRSLGWSAVTRTQRTAAARPSAVAPPTPAATPRPAGPLHTVNGAIVGAALLACLATIAGMLVFKRFVRRSYRYSRLASAHKDIIPLDTERAD
ncbi:hypothetical protein BO70DRAFT_395420 [Aspergillus heteromorphus CBS 117.55]|uniref:Arylsulfotransferase n=1 Tax=Aspergillus heteromorphus CBS 117.55 TaxID=1448321 RepID=A0A317WEN6_9EURO|nr:uncharacterized protein BO70DRAFT_395420 [Aspergillus heteromorphus CBS 117.55]PWY84739.1 hypothetical protein BO70DRAFT_395420 [Aspergillus heteromorphus CBS 117.55]